MVHKLVLIKYLKDASESGDSDDDDDVSGKLLYESMFFK